MAGCTHGFDDEGTGPDGQDGPGRDGSADTDADTDPPADDRTVGGSTRSTGAPRRASP